MAAGILVGVDDVAHKATKIYVSVDGVAHEVTKLYIGVDGMAHLAYEKEENTPSEPELVVTWEIEEPYYGNNTVQAGKATFTAAIVPDDGKNYTFGWGLSGNAATGSDARTTPFIVKPSSYRTGTVELTCSGAGLIRAAEITVAKQSVTVTSATGGTLTKSIPVITKIELID